MSHDASRRFDRIHARSLSDPRGFWGEAAEEISWIKPWETVLDDSNPPFYRWFKGGCSTRATTRSTATSRPATARGRRSSTTAR